MAATPSQHLRLNVLVVSESSVEHACGVTTSVRKATEYLRAQGHSVTIVCPAATEGHDPARFAGAEVITTPSVEKEGFAVGQTRKKDMTRLLQQIDPDVVHAASPMRLPKGLRYFLGGRAISAADALGVPVVAVYQTDAIQLAKHLQLGVATPVLERQIRKMHNKADITLVPSSSAWQNLVGWGVQPARIAWWGRGVDSTLFTAERRASAAVAALRNTWAPRGETILGLVSRLEPEKRIAKLAALRDLPDTTIVVVGKGTQRAALQQKLGPRTIFTGPLYGSDLADAYAAFDVFPFPSTSDTFAQVVQEAQASGAVVVAANRGGPRDLVHHGTTGYLYEPSHGKHPDTELLTYVRHLVGDPQLRLTMAEHARRAVAGRTWDAMGELLVSHYETARERRALRNATSALGPLAVAS